MGPLGLSEMAALVFHKWVTKETEAYVSPNKKHNMANSNSGGKKTYSTILFVGFTCAHASMTDFPQ